MKLVLKSLLISFIVLTGIQGIAQTDANYVINPADTAYNPEDDVFTVVEEIPDYTGGYEARTKFLQENIIYPEEAIKNKIQGTVYITFVVEKSGRLNNIRVLRGIGHGCDEEAVRVIKMMPRWQAGKQRGKPQRVQFNMPINFTLKHSKAKRK